MNPVALKYLSTSLLLGFGFFLVYGDFKRQRISNYWILVGLIVTLSLYALLGINTAIGVHRATFIGLGVYYLPSAFYLRAILNFILAFTAAIGLWYLRLWPAGDAKLFILFSTLLPLTDQNLRGFPSFLFLILLINIFVAAGIYVAVFLPIEWISILLRMLQENDLGKEMTALLSRAWKRLSDEWPKRYKWIMLAWNTFVLFFLFRIVLLSLHAPELGVLGYFIVYLALFLAWDRVCAFFIREDVTGASFFVVSAAVVPVGIYWKWDLISRFAIGGKMTFGFWTFMGFARGLLGSYLEKTRMAPIRVGELKPGVLLSRESWRRLEELPPAEPGAEEPARYSDGLSQEEISEIQKRITDPDRRLDAYRPRPFALWVFLGCIWTLSFRENLAEWLMQHLVSH